MPLLNRKRVILAKQEVSYGTDPTPTGAANAILVRNLAINPLGGETVDRDLVRPFLGQSEQLPSVFEVSIEFEVECQGAGAAGTAPAWGVLLKSCGFAETVTASTDVAYTPISDTLPSATFYVNVDGVLHKITGARGTVEIAIDAKGIPVMRFRFLGLFNAPTDTAAPVPTFTPWKTPLVANSTNTPTFSLHGVNPVLQSLSINVNNTLVHRSLIGADSVLITDRKVSGQAMIEATLIATKDWYTVSKSATLAALQLIHGTVAGSKFKIDAPNVQVVNPRYAESDGVAMLQFDINLIPGSSGNDELKISAL